MRLKRSHFSHFIMKRLLGVGVGWGGENHSAALFKNKFDVYFSFALFYIQDTYKIQWIHDCMKRKLGRRITGGGAGIFFHSFIFVQQLMPINHIESSSLSKRPMRDRVGCCCVLRNILPVLSQISVTVANFSLVPAAAELWGAFPLPFRRWEAKTTDQRQNNATLEESQLWLMVLSMPLH